jgi:hypothetical protein
MAVGCCGRVLDPVSLGSSVPRAARARRRADRDADGRCRVTLRPVAAAHGSARGHVQTRGARALASRRVRGARHGGGLDDGPASASRRPHPLGRRSEREWPAAASVRGAGRPRVRRDACWPALLRARASGLPVLLRAVYR